MAPNLPPSVYEIKVGNPSELLRRNQTESLDKLWEWITRYRTREGVTEILVTRQEPEVVGQKGPISIVALGAPTVMLALQRQSEDSPWNELTPGL